MNTGKVFQCVNILLFLLIGVGPNNTFGESLSINRNDYTDKLRGMWLGECIANWTGIQTEGDRTDSPFYTDANWSSIGFVLDQNPWLADDDTDIEYVYVHLLNQHVLTTLTPEQIRRGWMKHINSYIWVSNAKVRSMFDQGILPPATSLLNANELAIQIDAQLTTECFGALAPGMVHKALQMANLPILTTATGHAAHASQFHVVLYALACRLDDQISGRNQAMWLVDEASKYFPSTSKIIDIIEFVKADYLANPDMDDWESTRDKIYDRYHLHAADNGFRYNGWVESSVNFAAGIMALLYGEMDYRRTVKIGTLAGWDSDNPTATMAGLLGLVYGYENLIAEFPEKPNFSDRYHIYRTRGALPDYLPDDSQAEDTFTMIADRMCGIIDMAVTESGGSVSAGEWTLPEDEQAGVDFNPLSEIMQRSANHRVRSSGGSVTASSTAGGTNVNAIADGFEHNFSGEEWFGSAPEYRSSATDSATLTVVYNQPVFIHTIRLIEGESTTGFNDVNVEIKINGMWEIPVDGLYQDVPFDAAQQLQIIDFELNSPVEASGIRISGAVTGRLNILELDALSEPRSGSSNKPPKVSLFSPETGERFDVSSDIIIRADASDRDGHIVKVEFFSGSTLIGEDTSSPYQMNWENVPAGVYQLSVKATDDQGANTFSDIVWIMVAESSQGDGHVWHSYNVNTSGGSQPLLVYDEENAAPAVLELYESQKNGTVDRGPLFTSFNPGNHNETFNKVENFWANSSGNYGYPYVGKSTVDRGSDNGEKNPPAPLGVRDLQMHPPNNDHLTVAAFVAPFDGFYCVSGLAVRRVHNEGNTVRYSLFDYNQKLHVRLNASNNRTWVTDEEIYDLGSLSTGDRIYLAVDNGGNGYGWDATEVAWKITYRKEAFCDVSNKSKLMLPEDFALNQNYPNPFNGRTQIEFMLPADAKVSINIVDVLGQHVRSLKEGNITAGKHKVIWDGKNDRGNKATTGMYFVLMQVGSERLSIKLMLIK